MDNYYKSSHWDNSEPAAILYFDSNDMKQTNIYAESGSRRLTAYSIGSNRDLTVTTINRAYDSTPLAIVERREILPDMITLQGERQRMKKWLKLSGSSVFPAFFEHHGETYLWKCSIVGQLSFYNANRPEIPIAWFETSKKRVIEGVPNISRPYLALQPEALGIQDITIVSFLILEQKSRMITKSDQIITGGAGYGG